MSVFDHPEFDRHEAIHQFCDAASGLKAIIAIHSTALGPAAGGCRRWHYARSVDALTDVLRLSRGMTYKNAVAGLPFGGGKAVILATDDAPKSPELFAAFGRSVDALAGRYITAEDVGISVNDMRHVARRTRFVSGLPQTGGSAGGDPSPWTALGVFLGMQAAASARLGADGLNGLRVAVQGVGNVGLNLCRLLHEAGASIVVADVNPDPLRRIRDEMPVREVSPDEILFCEVDIVAPCALGSVLTTASIGKIRAHIVAGGANNQLGNESDGELLRDREILYAPDYVINGGGIVSAALEFLGHSTESQVRTEVGRIPDRLLSIFAKASATNRPTNQVANELARSLVAAGPVRSNDATQGSDAA